MSKLQDFIDDAEAGLAKHNTAILGNRADQSEYYTGLLLIKLAKAIQVELQELKSQAAPKESVSNGAKDE